MANNVIKRTWNQNKMVCIEDLSGMAFQSESGGHTFEISGTDDSGTAVSLSGTVEARFLRADNVKVTVAGTISSGKASVTLTSNCYTVAGRFSLTIFVTSNSQKVAVYSAVGNVAVTDGVSSGTVPPLVTDSIQTGSMTASGNVTVNGVLDVTQRRCYRSLSSEGWFRAIRFDADNSFSTCGSDGSIIDIDISRLYNNTDNEAHHVRLIRTYNNNKFVGEESISNTLGIDKVRLMADLTNEKAYIDIHYTLETVNPVGVHFDVSAVENYADDWFAESLQYVVTSPSGETELALYTFVANTGTPVSFSPTSGSVHNACWYARIGNVCYLHVDMKDLTPLTNTQIFTLPVGYRPLYPTAIQGQGQESYGALASCVVQTDGNVSIYSQDHYAVIDGSFICEV